MIYVVESPINNFKGMVYLIGLKDNIHPRNFSIILSQYLPNQFRFAKS
jgi:hypothetical protein